MENFKARGFASERGRLDRRRAAFAERHAEHRNAVMQRLRNLRDVPHSPEDTAKPDRSRRRRRNKEKPTSEIAGCSSSRFVPAPLMLPEWLIDIPQKFSEEWFVRPRPSGKHALLVVSRGGRATLRNKNGRLLRSPFMCSVLREHHERTVLDVILPYEHTPRQDFRMDDSETVHLDVNEQTRRDKSVRLLVMDVLEWNGFAVYDCAAEFRLNWIQNQVTEIVNVSDSAGDAELEVVPFLSNSSDALYLYHERNTFRGVDNDGLIFYHTQGMYSIGFSPLVLQWKDSQSPMFIETLPEPPPIGIEVAEIPLVTALRIEKDFTLVTADNPAFCLGNLNSEKVDTSTQEMDDPNLFAPGQLLNWTVLNPMHLLDNNILDIGLELRYHSRCSSARSVADCVSRILFQALARFSPVTFEVLSSASKESGD
mmetsp:Transcript_1342/g.2447  ORF Transcript_1342/g.2447 Transcript_1342/m.2447 type:complete len:425 (-) Transcript_1342:1049-2323(-)